MPKPAIFIPGFPASELLDPAGHIVFPPSISTLGNAAKKTAYIAELIDVPGDLVAGVPVPSILGGLVPEAQSLYNLLATFGYDITPASTNFVPFGWDWRLGVGAPATVARLKTVLDKLSPDKNGNVIAVLHSTGGLVFRAFLEKEPTYAKCFEQVLTFGIPWAGTLEALHAVDVGVSVGLGPIKLLTEAEGAKVFGHAQAAYDLFPTDPSLNLFVSGGVSTTPRADPSWTTQQFQRDLLTTAHGPFARQFDDLRLTNVCGWGAPTWPVVTLVGGKITWLAKIKEAGDGTVPFVSSSWLQGAKVRPVYVPIGAYGDEGLIPMIHGQLWASVAIKQIFGEVFGGAAIKPFVAAAADSDQAVDPSAPTITIRISAMGPDGAALPGATANYRLGTQMKSDSFNGKPRLDIAMPRGAFAQEAAPNIRRMELDILWPGGDPVRIPLLITTA